MGRDTRSGQGEPVGLKAFIEQETKHAAAIDLLAGQVGAYGRELAGLFSCPAPAVRVSIVGDEDWAE